MHSSREGGRSSQPLARRTSRFSLLCLSFALVAGAVASASAFVPPWLVEPHPERPLPTLARTSDPNVPPVDPSLAQGRENFDVLRYELSVFPDFVGKAISGNVNVTFASLIDGLTSIDLDLNDNMIVDAVTFGGLPIASTHQDHVVRVFLPEALDRGRTSTISVQYHGTPQPSGFMGLQFLTTKGGAPTMSTLSQPYFARSWWPCKDTPTDKAQLQLYVVAPDGMFVASNGILVGRQPLGNGSLFTWVETYPISTYNVSLAIAEYVSWSENFVGPDQEQLELEYHVYPEDEVAARYDFGRTGEILDYYIERFGQYPFIGEKYGMAEFVFVGAMEHQTMASYGDYFLTGDRFYERIIGHELAHQWWGNSMTLASWADLWIHEGLATFSEGLWVEQAQGPIAYRNFLRNREAACCGFIGPISPPTELFNDTVYNKSAWMFHMLRRTLGDNDFFGALSDLAARPELRYGSIRTTDVVEQFEQSTGRELSWFFDQWLYRVGRPMIASSWTSQPSGDRFRVEITIEQTGAGPAWTFPFDLRVVTAAGNVDVQTWISSATHRYTVFVDAEPTDLVLDPFESLLWFEDGSAPTSAPMPFGGARLLPNVPNPFNPRTTLRFELPQATQVELRIVDARGRVVDVLRPGVLGAGLHELPWSGTDLRGAPVASGVYQVQLHGADGTSSVRPVTLVR